MSGGLFVGGRIFTGRGENDFASAMRVADGVVAWIGDAAEVAGEPAVDLGGRTVLPGLLDVHTHPGVIVTKAGAADCLPPAVASLAGLIETLRAAAGDDTDAWILGTGYDDARYPEGRAPEARDLDAVSRTRPVLVWRCDEHSASCNTRALELAGITAATPDPPGARFERDENGAPTGVLTEVGAVQAVSRLIPEPDAPGYARLLAQLDDHFLSHGITALCDLFSHVVPDALGTFRAARALGLRSRVGLYPAWTPELADLQDGDREGPVRIAGTKVLIDGAFSNRTAWIEEPYPDSCDHGIRTLTDDELRSAAGWARRNGVQLAVHAMGDRALHHVVDLLGDEEPWLERVPSVRIEHATLVAPDLRDRLTGARMRFGIATHTIFLYAETDAYRRNLDAARTSVAYPVRSLYATGIPLALSSDRPATAWSDADDVFVSIAAAVSRRAHDGSDIGAAEAITVPQAVLLYTGRARAVADLGAVGVLEPGAAADFVVLDRDVFTAPVDEIARTRIAETWIAGERVWARD